jgi:hypothetical protein
MTGIVLDLQPTYSFAVDLEGEEASLTLTVATNAIAVDLVPALRSIGSVPAGGTEDQVLAKVSDDDYDYEWVDPPNTGIDPAALAAALAYAASYG